MTQEPILRLLYQSGCIAEDGHPRSPYRLEMSSLLRKLHRLPYLLEREAPDPKPLFNIEQSDARIATDVVFLELGKKPG